MTNQVLIRENSGKVREHIDVLYCEQTVRDRDNISGIAIQYGDDTTEFIPRADILGVYPEASERVFTLKYDDLMN